MERKISCCFAGHKTDWHNIGIEGKLYAAIEELIKKGVNVFFDGNMGDFDNKARKVVLDLKKKYPYIKLILVLSYYHENKDKYEISSIYDDSIFPNTEEVYFKNKIIMKNRWIVDNSDYIIAHIVNEVGSGAFKTVKYALKKNKNVIMI